MPVHSLWIASLFSLFISSAPAHAAKPADFHTDGCSWFPDCQWLHCCVAHDVRYFAGGTETERLRADEGLYNCVEKIKGEKFAGMMFQGVRKGGSPKINTPFRWGYAWDYGRGYRALSLEERADTQDKIFAFKCEREMLALTKDRDMIAKICKTFEAPGPSLRERLSTFFNRF